MEDADEAVAELAERGEGLEADGVDEPVIADVAGEDKLLLLARRAGDRASAGVVLAGFGVGVTVLVVTELGEHPGAEHGGEAGLAEVDLSVRVLAKDSPTCSSMVLTWVLSTVRIAT
jgi:hypothetical protein